MTVLKQLAADLSDALECETVAIRSGDYDAAGRLSGAKLAALRAFAEAAAEPTASIAPPAVPEAQAEGEVTGQSDVPDSPDVFDRLRVAANENRAALEAALAVQGRIVEVLTSALRAQSGTPPAYGNTAPPQPKPFVLSVKA